MATNDKALARMRNNPRDWRIASLETIAAANGINVRQTGGSHVVFEHPDLIEALSVPAHRPIKPIYIQRFVRFIDAIRSAHERD